MMQLTAVLPSNVCWASRPLPDTMRLSMFVRPPCGNPPEMALLAVQGRDLEFIGANRCHVGCCGLTGTEKNYERKYR